MAFKEIKYLCAKKNELVSILDTNEEQQRIQIPLPSGVDNDLAPRIHDGSSAPSPRPFWERGPGLFLEPGPIPSGAEAVLL